MRSATIVTRARDRSAPAGRTSVRPQLSFPAHAAQAATAREAQAALAGRRPQQAADARRRRPRGPRRGRGGARVHARRGRGIVGRPRRARGRRLHVERHAGASRRTTPSRARRGRPSSGTRSPRPAARTTRSLSCTDRTTSRSTQAQLVHNLEHGGDRRAVREGRAGRDRSAAEVVRPGALPRNRARPLSGARRQDRTRRVGDREPVAADQGHGISREVHGVRRAGFSAFFDAYQFQGPERFPADTRCCPAGANSRRHGVTTRRGGGTGQTRPA